MSKTLNTIELQREARCRLPEHFRTDSICAHNATPNLQQKTTLPRESRKGQVYVKDTLGSLSVKLWVIKEEGDHFVLKNGGALTFSIKVSLTLQQMHELAAKRTDFVRITLDSASHVFAKRTDLEFFLRLVNK